MNRILRYITQYFNYSKTFIWYLSSDVNNKPFKILKVGKTRAEIYIDNTIDYVV